MDGDRHEVNGSAWTRRDGQRRRVFGGAARTAAVVLAVAVAGLTGCAQRPYAEPMATAADDMLTSPAWAYREFQPMSATYENTAVVAWSTRFPFVDRPDQPDLTRPVVEPAIFLTNVLVLPVSVVVEPPFWRQHAWRPVGLHPTHTAAVRPDEVVHVAEGAIVPALRPGLGEREPGTESHRYGKFPRRAMAPAVPAASLPPPADDQPAMPGDQPAMPGDQPAMPGEQPAGLPPSEGVRP
ncbi:MAG: hypothetical protein ACK4PI_06710 [Tepidisphaerales bacterium]